MGGQACVFYGAAQFSRDLDLLVLADAESLNALRQAMDLLEAEPIAVPPFELQFLSRGHAVHFRCEREDVQGLRIDVMSRLRGVGDFEELWTRRTTIQVEDAEVDMLSVPDLVRAKKTHRDKDWPMIGNLVEQVYFSLPSEPSPEQIEFLLEELRTPKLLRSMVEQFPDAAGRIAPRRLAVACARVGNLEEVRAAIGSEEALERERDRAYWDPLKDELEQIRRTRMKRGGD